MKTVASFLFAVVAAIAAAFAAPTPTQYVRSGVADNVLQAPIVGSTTAPIYSAPVASIAALRALNVTTPALVNGAQIQVSGYYAANDGGGGTYVWNSASTAADNGGTVIQATGVATGRWLLQYSGDIDPLWFGAKPNGRADAKTALTNAIAAAVSTGVGVRISSGTYLLETGVSVTDLCSIRCAPNVTINYSGTGFYVFDIGRGVQFHGNGVTINITNNSWNGGAIQLNGVHRFSDDVPAIVSGITVNGNSTSKGTGLYLTATSAGYFISFVRFSNLTFANMNYAVTADCGSSGSAGDGSTWHWINGNVFDNIHCYGTNYGVLLNGLNTVPAEVAGNLLSNWEFQVSSTPIHLTGASHNYLTNMFVWDWNYASGSAVIFDGSNLENVLLSNIRTEGITGYANNLCTTPIGEITHDRTFTGNVNINGYLAVAGEIQTSSDLWVKDTNPLKIGYNGFQATIANGGAGPLTLTPTAGYNIVLNSEVVASGKTTPNVDNSYTLGSATNRWSTVYAANGTINTSDERDKQSIEPISPAVLRAWAKVKFAQFRFNSEVASEGKQAPIHFGVIAQRIKDAFESENLDALKYGVLVLDRWTDRYENDSKGNKILVLKAGERYGVRYDEALVLECAYIRSQLFR